MFRPAALSRADQTWIDQKKKLQLQFSKLTEKDFVYETGSKYAMIKKIGVKLGKTEAEMKRIFQAL